MTERRLAVTLRQFRVRFLDRRHPREVFPTKLTNDEEMERNLGEWRPMNVLYECDGVNVLENIQKDKKSRIMPQPLFALTA